ncbi:hypothetical protein [Streptomyces tendae]|uniref:hypothetical protein n=1 Tax=Streptomyces tendae TaxID=1932 RepID=UPI003790B63F
MPYRRADSSSEAWVSMKSRSRRATSVINSPQAAGESAEQRVVAPGKAADGAWERRRARRGVEAGP